MRNPRQAARFLFNALLCSIGITCYLPSAIATERWSADVFPAEWKEIQDETSGAKLVFVTTAESNDINAYFHQRSWLPDESVLFFQSDRTGRNEIWGCLERTGELIRLQRDGDDSISHFTAALKDNALYFLRNKQLYELRLEVDASSDPENRKSKIEIGEKCIASLPPDADSPLGISESSDSLGIVVGFKSTGSYANRVIWIDKHSGQNKEICAVDYTITHIQCSWETPGLISFAREYPGEGGDWAQNVAEGRIRARIHWADLSDREPWPIYPQENGELVTHECWWTHDRMTFCSGQYKNGDAEQGHVKVYDPRLDFTYIIGPGSWWDGGEPKDVSKVNYWHASGSPDGRFVAGDNWHGIISLFSAKTARTRILTQNHRTYGKGAHLHVGWGPSSTKVIFTSNRFGNPDVCVAVLPEGWLDNSW